MDWLVSVAMFFGPVVALCAVAWIWAKHSRVPRLASILRASAIFWLPAMTLVFVFLVLASVACQGNAIYGYGDCKIFPEAAANASLAVFALGVVCGIGYAALLFLIGAGIEWRARR